MHTIINVIYNERKLSSMVIKTAGTAYIPQKGNTILIQGFPIKLEVVEIEYSISELDTTISIYTKEKK